MKSLCFLTTKIWKATKNAKIGVVWGVKSHPRSSETLPFDTAHMTSYSTLIETMRLSCIESIAFSSYNAFFVESGELSHPTCICRPHMGWSRSNFAVIVGVRKLVTTLSCGIICVIMRLAVLIQYRSVSDTHIQTGRRSEVQTHDDGLYRA